MGHGIHQMDLLLHLLGDWSEVRAMAGRLVHDVESEDVSTALVRFESGAWRPSSTACSAPTRSAASASTARTPPSS